MLKLKLFDFYVRGRGDFPVDMLRFDNCWPADGDAAALLVSNYESGSHLKPRTIHMRSIQPPTKARWASFMWPAAETDVWK